MVEASSGINSQVVDHSVLFRAGCKQLENFALVTMPYGFEDGLGAVLVKRSSFGAEVVERRPLDTLVVPGQSWWNAPATTLLVIAPPGILQGFPVPEAETDIAERGEWLLTRKERPGRPAAEGWATFRLDRRGLSPSGKKRGTGLIRTARKPGLLAVPITIPLRQNFPDMVPWAWERIETWNELFA